MGCSNNDEGRKARLVTQVLPGSEDHHTVYEAEQVGLIMGLHLIAEQKRRRFCAIGSIPKAVAGIQSLQMELTNPAGYKVTVHGLTAVIRYCAESPPDCGKTNILDIGKHSHRNSHSHFDEAVLHSQCKASPHD